MGKIFRRRVWKVPGVTHLFSSEHDAKYYCEQHNIDFDTVTRYDSTKEYLRWLELLDLERRGEISDLRRQVEFTLAEPVFKPDIKRTKDVKIYIVNNLVFNLKAEAKAYCKKNKIPEESIVLSSKKVPVYVNKKILEGAVYTADFTYVENGFPIVEDCKSEFTKKEKDYVLRKKWLYQRHGVLIRET